MKHIKALLFKLSFFWNHTVKGIPYVVSSSRTIDPIYSGFDVIGHDVGETTTVWSDGSHMTV